MKKNTVEKYQLDMGIVEIQKQKRCFLQVCGSNDVSIKIGYLGKTIDEIFTVFYDDYIELSKHKQPIEVYEEEEWQNED